MKVYTFNNDDNAVRAGSSAGGLFSAFAESILKEGGSVYGAAFDDDWNVVHRRIDSAEMLPMLRGSKYVFTEIGKYISLVASDLAEGRQVLFCGTPCQIAVLRKRFGNANGLLLVEVVCHGAPQPKYWNLYLDELLQNLGKSRTDIKSINFRDKTDGWKNYAICITFKDGTCYKQNHMDNPYILTFIYDYTLRPGCVKCPFKNPNSKADISMGDFWGIQELAPELDNNLGTTIAIADTLKGERILDSIACLSHLRIEQVAKYNPAIVKAPIVPSDKAEFETMVSTQGFIRSSKYVLRPIFQQRHTTLKNKIKSNLYRLYTILRK